MGWKKVFCDHAKVFYCSWVFKVHNNGKVFMFLQPNEMTLWFANDDQSSNFISKQRVTLMWHYRSCWLMMLILGMDVWLWSFYYDSLTANCAFIIFWIYKIVFLGCRSLVYKKHKEKKKRYGHQGDIGKKKKLFTIYMNINLGTDLRGIDVHVGVFFVSHLCFYILVLTSN